MDDEGDQVSDLLYDSAAAVGFGGSSSEQASSILPGAGDGVEWVWPFNASEFLDKGAPDAWKSFSAALPSSEDVFSVETWGNATEEVNEHEIVENPELEMWLPVNRAMRGSKHTWHEDGADE